MFVRRLRLIALLTVAAALLAAAPASTEIVAFKSIAGVELGAQESDVLAGLGEPSSTRQGEVAGARVLVYRPRKLEVMVGGGQVVAVETRSRAEKMSNGVGVGTSLATLKRKVRGERCNKLRLYTICAVTKREVTMDFYVRRGKVYEVALAPSPEAPE